ncbi:hypothetical protein BDV32DRAFT_23484 [Aspergillus pseudonomiae]|nr:hypothetical protein BDV32DRAFT_23484 [Aspergillus pseudonomiae]
MASCRLRSSSGRTLQSLPLLCWRAQTLACFMERPERPHEMGPSITPLPSDWLISGISLSESLGCFHLITTEPLTRRASSFSHLGNFSNQCLILSVGSGCRRAKNQDGVLFVA